MTGQNAPAKIAVRPSIEKAADMEASASATMKAANLTAVMERRAPAASGVTVTLMDCTPCVRHEIGNRSR
jgi:hypothetical protein